MSEQSVTSLFLTYPQAAQLTGVALSTFRGYVSKQWIRPLPEFAGRGCPSFFDAEEVEELRQALGQRKARRGDGQRVVDGHKKCTKCQQMVQVSEFKRCATTRTGLQSWCNQCTGHSSAAWHQKNKAKRQEQKRAWYRAHPEVLAAEKRRYYERHRDQIRAYMRKWHRKSTPRTRAYKRDYQRAWNQRNADYKRAYKKAQSLAKAQDKKNPRAYLKYLVQLISVKVCPSCRRLLSLSQFDRHGRTIDGYSIKCLCCLPPRKTPPGGYLLELDRKLRNTADSYNGHDVLADRNAISPERAAIASVMEGLLWNFVDTLPEEQSAFLLAFVDTLDVEAAATEVGIRSEQAQALLTRIRETASASLSSLKEVL